ncbi:MAG TPA: DNA-3-methyladenine glycosylase I [Bacteroidales bacterium]|nr:DNA-3-methyladenine glycosylase I [Bacteroidales bacterium]
MTLNRCAWCGDDPLYISYHDHEWGVPVHDETKHFEFLLLESAQAGLSWITILRKRENYRLAFDGFDPEKIARYDDAKIADLLQNPGIIRNKRKIASAINNAQKFLDVRHEFGSFDQFIWQYVDGRPIVNHFSELSDIPVTTALSDTISRDLKNRGFNFVGSTIIYAHLQAIGIVNDHLISCFRHAELS